MSALTRTHDTVSDAYATFVRSCAQETAKVLGVPLSAAQEDAVLAKMLPNVDSQSYKITLTVEGVRKSSFKCPQCERKLTVTANYVTQWLTKSCSGCRSSWRTTGSVGEWDRSEDVIGQQFELSVYKVGSLE